MILPEFISLQDWAASLIIDFPDENIPLLLDEKQWKEWGSYLIYLDAFQENEAPDPLKYDDWREWARQVYFTMNNNS